MVLRTIVIALAIVAAAAMAVAAQSKCDESKVNTKNRPLCIVKKPRAGYTEDARKHNVQGCVVVNVEFLSDATIGTVNWINTDATNAEDLLKYGVVQGVIDAARKIEFLPEIKDGSAITVTKRNEYCFSIY